MAREQFPAISPDGQWVAYTSNQTGSNQIFVERFPELGERQAITAESGTKPRWSKAGLELFYVNVNSVNAVSMDDQPVFQPGTPAKLFEGDYLGGAFVVDFDVAADGQRFLMVKPGFARPDLTSGEGTSELGRAQIIFVQNWFEELKARVPTGQ